MEFSNFDKVELFSEENTLEDKIQEYLDEDEATSEDLFEVYKREVLAKDAAIKDLVDFAVSRKSFNNPINYSALKEAVDESRHLFESLDTEAFKFYKERLSTHPLTRVNYFNFNEDVKVSLVETEPRLVVTSTLKEKAENLYKNEDFKDKFVNAANVFVEDVEEGTDMFKELLEEYPCIFTLDEAERKTLFGKLFIRDKELRENISDLNKGFDILFESMDIKDLRDEYMLEADEDMEDDIPSQDMDGEEEKKEAPAKEVNDGEADKLIHDLKEIAKNLTIPELKKLVDELIKKIEDFKIRGTNTNVVKEAVEILSL